VTEATVSLRRNGIRVGGETLDTERSRVNSTCSYPATNTHFPKLCFSTVLLGGGVPEVERPGAGDRAGAGLESRS
jgi:hypothetical protein